MADIPISQLDSVNDANAGDKLIINVGDSTTKKIDFTDLIKGLADGGGGDEGGGVGGFGFAPQFHVFTGNSVDISVSAWTSQSNIHPGAVPITVKMPHEADMALISFQYNVSMWSLPNTQNAGPVWAQFGGGINLSGGNVKSSAGCNNTTSICMGANMSMYNPIMAYEANPHTAFTVNQAPIKFSILTFDKGVNGVGTSVTFTPTGSLKRAKKCICNKTAGRMILYPFNSAAIDIATLEKMVAAANADSYLDIAPDPLPDEEKGVQTEIIVEKLRYVTDVCNKTLSDPNFASQYGTLEAIRNDAFALRTSTLVFSLLDAECDALLARMREVPGLGVSFPGIGASSTYGLFI